MKSDVEMMLPKKKEIIIYANMTEHQKNLRDHLVNKTLGNYLKEKMSRGKIYFQFLLSCYENKVFFQLPHYNNIDLYHIALLQDALFLEV